MPLNASGPISIGGSTTGESINLEIGRTATQQSALEEASLRTLAGKGTPGSVISLSDFYGKSNESYWIVTISSTQFINPRRVVIDSASNIYLTGIQNAQGTNLPNAFLMKFNSSGSLQWQRSNGSNANDWGCDIAIDANSNVFCMINAQAQGPALCKYDSNGTQSLSRRLLPSDSGENISAFMSTNNASVYVVGQGTAAHAGATNLNVQMAIVDLNINATTYLNIGDSTINGIRRAVRGSDGSIYICGSTGSNSGFVGKLDSSGNVTWVRAINQSAGNNVVAQSLTIDPNGNIYVVGSFGPNQNSFVSMYNNSGTLQWRKMFNTGSLPLSIQTVAADASGCIIGGSYTENTTTGLTKGYLARYNNTGVNQWYRYFYHNNPGNTIITSVRDLKVLASGAFIAVINARRTTFNDGVMFKFPADGSKTGTYGNYVYESATFNDAGTGLAADTTPTWSTSSAAMTIFNLTYPASTTTFSTSTTSV